MSELHDRIEQHVKSEQYRPAKPRKLARELDLGSDEHYPGFRDALRDLMEDGRVALGQGGTVVPPVVKTSTAVSRSTDASATTENPSTPLGRDEVVGMYRGNKRGFGFVIPSDPPEHADLFIPEGEHNGAMTGDSVRARITGRNMRDGRQLFSGRVTEVLKRQHKRFAGTLSKVAGEWVVLPDGNTFTQPILAPDAASRHIKAGTKVVIELTSYAEPGQNAQGVITEVLGQAGEKDVDLRGVIIQHSLPLAFPEEVVQQARDAVDSFNPTDPGNRLDLTEEVVCTIDPDDAKDYDDAISLRKTRDGLWQLGVHIADVSYFVPAGSPLDVEAKERGNSSYFPGHVIPMLPEILSNGVCSLQEGVPRFCKSTFITFDEDYRPRRTAYASTLIKSRKRLRYTEAQDLIDHKSEIRHPGGNKTVADYDADVLKLLYDMDEVARHVQKRRRHDGQLVLTLPEVALVMDEEGKVIDAKPEDDSFTHTLIEMFMVEANEAVARLLDALNVPFLRRTHPDPDLEDTEKLRNFVQVSGHKLPKILDRKAIQILLEKVRDTPEGFAINLAILKSLTRAEYSPAVIGHFALASEHYSHFTSPIRRYADLTIHRLLDAYFTAENADFSSSPVGKPKGGRKTKVKLEGVPTERELIDLGKHISFTERRSEEAERELRNVKILELMKQHIGDDFPGVVTGITKFGIFVQLQTYLNDGLIRYENLMDDWWQVDEKSGSARGQRTGVRIAIGDTVTARVVRVDVPRRELDLAIIEVRGRKPAPKPQGASDGPSNHEKQKQKFNKRTREHKVHKAVPPGARGGGRTGTRPGGRKRR